jgi:hypothetical protein
MTVRTRIRHLAGVAAMAVLLLSSLTFGAAQRATAGQAGTADPADSSVRTVRVMDTDGTVHTLALTHGPALRAEGALDGYFSTKTGVTYQGHSVWTTTYQACLGEGLGPLNIWRECMSFRVYFNGLSVWGRNHTLAGLSGSLVCHSDGSYGYGFDHRLLSCGEHNLSSAQMKDWYSFDECTVPSFNCNYRAFHVYFSADGDISGPYTGLGV